MVAVDLVSSWGTRCGIAEYASDLVNAADKAEVHFRVHAPQSAGMLHSFEGQIVHLNHEDGLLRMWGPDEVRRLQAMGKRVLMTKHNSDFSCRTALASACNVVVVHETSGDGFVHIPHGIHDWVNPGIKPQMKIGTAGFPQGHKAFTETAKLAKELGVGLLVITAESPHGDAHATADAIHAVHPDAEVITDWLSKDEVAAKMAECVVTVFLRWSNMSGISGAVRLGLMSGRPVVITQDRQFRDLYTQYPEEVYLIDLPVPSMDAAKSVTEFAISHQLKKPKRILYDMSWKRCAEQYVNLYRGLAA